MMSAKRRVQTDDAPEVLDGQDRLQCAAHHLPGAGALGFVGEASLEQLGIGENDAELVIEPMEHLRKVRRWFHRFQW